MALARAQATKTTATEQDQQQRHAADDSAVIAALTAWLATSAAIAATSLPSNLISELGELGIPARAATEAGDLALPVRMTGRSRHGAPAHSDGDPLVRLVASEEPNLRAQYILAAARRLAQGLADADLSAALERERRYLEQHVAAGRNRRKAAKAVDEVAAQSATGFMRWNCKNDEHTTPDCRALEGRIFTTMRWYSGEVVELLTSSGDLLAVTPNHPILTPQGWIAAGLLDEGRQVVRTGLAEALVRLVNPDDCQAPALIEDVAAAFSKRGGVSARAVPVSAEDFHGDGVGSEITVVRADSELWDRLDSAETQPGGVEQLSGVASRLSMAPLGTDALLLPRVLDASNGRMSRLGVASVLVGRSLAHHETVGFGLVSPGDAAVVQDLSDGRSVDAVGSRELVLAHPGFVSGADVAGRQTGIKNPRYFTSGTSQIVGDDPRPVGAALFEARNQLLRGTACLSGYGIRSEVAGLIEIDRVKKVRRYRRWNGHVYNLETSTGWYVSGNILTHNCRCWATPWGGAPLRI
jgi:hypothetical protein